MTMINAQWLLIAFLIAYGAYYLAFYMPFHLYSLHNYIFRLFFYNCFTKLVTLLVSCPLFGTRVDSGYGMVIHI